MRAILLNGSPAELSHTGALLAHISECFMEKDVEAEIINLNMLSLGINDPKIHSDPSKSKSEDVRNLAEVIASADIVILGTPLYHGSFSGLIKIALDHLVYNAFEGKQVAIVSNASGARGSYEASQALVVVARTMKGQVSNTLIGTCKADYELLEDEMTLVSDDIVTRCQRLVDELVA